MTAQTTTVELDRSGFDDLRDQLVDGKSIKAQQSDKQADIRSSSTNATKPDSQERPSTRMTQFVLTKGDKKFELDEDFELEMMADKKPIRMTLRELKDRAAGDVAVKNRMHALAEEKKRVQATFKSFAEIAKNDPLAALEFISTKANEADSEFEYDKYIQKLADQAESLGKMNDEQRKAHDLEKKLKKAEQDLSQKERQERVVLRKHEILADHPQIGDSEFGEMVNAVLGNEELMEGLNDETDVMNRVEDLIQETLTQRDIMTVIREINPDHLNDNQLIFSLSDQLKQNPDLDEEDVRDIIRALIAPAERVRDSQPTQRQRDIQTLSNKQRQSMALQHQREQSADPYDLLKEQLLARKAEISKTPLYKR